jgi:hypothetical protein
MTRDIKDIFNEDQVDRKQPDYWENTAYYTKRDLERRQEVEELLVLNKLQTGEDLYQGAIIFHHSEDLNDLEKAKGLAKRSIGLAYDKAKWLYAAITDRMLFVTGEPQKYGTQFYKKSPTSKWELYRIDPSVTDQERSEYNVPNLDETRKQISKLNEGGV